VHAFALPIANAPDHGAQFNVWAEARSATAMKVFAESFAWPKVVPS